MSPANVNPLKKLQEFGQSIYLDAFQRAWLTDGTLSTLIERDGLRGVTSNPSIFQKAIAESDDYKKAISAHARRGDDALTTYEDLVVEDIQSAADLFRPIFDGSDGRFGFVSLEVSPEIANDEEATVTEAKHLWKRLSRPNAFIKVPATEAGIGAIRRLIAAGVNVNITLLFGLPRYRQVIDAYLAGLEERLEKGLEISHVASVASFFLSRIDVMIDPLLDVVANNGGPQASAAQQLRGQAAVASAKRAYVIYQQEFAADSERFKPLAAAGARTQRLLWASTSTKDPSYPDTKYVEPLVGRDTINTLPMETLDAYRDHGHPADSISDGADEAQAHLMALSGVGVDIDKITHDLEIEGAEKFVKAYRSLLSDLEEALTSAPA